MENYSKESSVLDLEQIYSSAPFGMYVLDTDLRFVRINQKFADINALPAADHIGRTPLDIRPDIARQIESMSTTVFQTGRAAHIEYESSAPDEPGRKRFWLDNYYPLKSKEGVVRGVSVIVQDITNQKKAEAELRELNQELEQRIDERMIELPRANSEPAKLDRIEETPQGITEMPGGTFDAGIVGVAMFSLDGDFLEVNRALCDMLGFSELELLKKNWIEVTHPDDVEKTKKYDEQMRLAQIPNFTVEKRYINKQGKIIWAITGSAYAYNAEGQPQNIIAHMLDISERKRIEQALRKNERRLRKLTSRLVSIREMERTMISREIHDELGQALTCLKLDLAWLGKRLPMNSVTETMHVNRMTSLLDRTLTQVREISSRLRPPILDDLGIEAAIEWETQEFERRSGCECKVELKADNLSADTNRDTAIFRIFQESLTNIARHANASRVEVMLKKISESIVLKISDNGKGISDEALDSTQSLGLIGMEERVRAMDGKLRIWHPDAGGTEVSLVVPLDR